MTKNKPKTSITKSKTIHFIGIGGAGMSPIAKILLQQGYTITGSDLKESVNTIRLKDLGATIFLKHNISHMRKADIVIISTAIPKTNPEYLKAKEDNIPILIRAEMLAFIMNEFPKRIAVTGTHGKTTTSSMITRMLDKINKQPSFVIGSEMLDYGTSSSLNGSEYIVVESDESDGSFLHISPNIGVINNIEKEHMEYYKTWENLCSHFNSFMTNIIKNKGYIIINNDDESLHKLSQDFPLPSVIRYGIKEDAPIMATDISHTKNGVSYTLMIQGKKEGRIQLQVQGVHNIYNSLASLCVGLLENASLDLCIHGLNAFSGTKRRLQLIGKRDELSIFDDYAHHPTEIKMTLDGMSQAFKQSITCIFQPHRYTRTRDLMVDFANVLPIANHVIVCEIFSSDEPPIPNISGKNIIDLIHDQGHKNAIFISKKSDIPTYIIDHIHEHEIIVTMGAGDIHTVGKEILKRLQIIHEELEKRGTP